MHFYGWKNGLKTGMYYLRSRPAVDAIKFTVDYQKLKEKQKNSNGVNGNDTLQKKNINETQVCPLRRPGLDDDEECLACGS